MTVKEFIALLSTFPQDAIVTQDFCSDVEEIEPEHIRFRDGAKDYEESGRGLIRHHGNLMELQAQWWSPRLGERPEMPEFVKCVHIRGN